jgi:hypothetical protein
VRLKALRDAMRSPSTAHYAAGEDLRLVFSAAALFRFIPEEAFVAPSSFFDFASFADRKNPTRGAAEPSTP